MKECIEGIFLSIIIPVFNAEKFIKTCLDSIFALNLAGIEVVVINDGSTDNSLEVLKQFEGKIILVNQENSGVSKTRNNGFNIARGNYVMFMDADDILLPEFEQQYIKLRNDSNPKDFYIFDYLDISMEGEVLNKVKVLSTGENKKEVIKEFVLGYYINTCWGKLVRKDLIIENNLFFDDSMKIGEDAHWIGELLSYVDKIEYYPYSIYGYRQNDSGAMSKYRKCIHGLVVYDFEKEVNQKKLIIENCRLGEDILERYCYLVICESIARISLAASEYSSFLKYKSDALNFLNKKFIKESFERIKFSKNISTKRKVIIFMIKTKFLCSFYLYTKWKGKN